MDQTLHERDSQVSIKKIDSDIFIVTKNHTTELLTLFLTSSDVVALLNSNTKVFIEFNESHYIKNF